MEVIALSADDTDKNSGVPGHFGSSCALSTGLLEHQQRLLTLMPYSHKHSQAKSPLYGGNLPPWIALNRWT